MGTHGGKGMAALGSPCECLWALQHRLRAFGTHFGSCREHCAASGCHQELACHGHRLCLACQHIGQGDEHAGSLERKLQRAPKVVTQFANCRLPIGGEEHRESLHALILCPQVRSEAWYRASLSLLPWTPMPTPCTESCLAEISFWGQVSVGFRNPSGVQGDQVKPTET